MPVVYLRDKSIEVSIATAETLKRVLYTPKSERPEYLELDGVHFRVSEIRSVDEHGSLPPPQGGYQGSTDTFAKLDADSLKNRAALEAMSPEDKSRREWDRFKVLWRCFKSEPISEIPQSVRGELWDISVRFYTKYPRRTVLGAKWFRHLLMPNTIVPQSEFHSTMLGRVVDNVMIRMEAHDLEISGQDEYADIPVTQ